MSDAANERGARVTTRGTEFPRTIRKAASAVAAFMNYVAGWNFIFCAAFITIDVVCRNFGGFSSSATTEITSYMLAFGLAWGLAHALATRSHIRIDVLVNRLPIGVRQYLHAFALVLLTGLSLFLAWCAWALSARACSSTPKTRAHWPSRSSYRRACGPSASRCSRFLRLS